MSHYYFHLRDGKDVLLDPEGCDLPDLAAVARRALESARSILSADLLDGLLKLDMRIDVEDEAGRLVHRLPFAEAFETIPPDAWVRQTRPSPLR